MDSSAFFFLPVPFFNVFCPFYVVAFIFALAFGTSFCMRSEGECRVDLEQESDNGSPVVSGLSTKDI